MSLQRSGQDTPFGNEGDAHAFSSGRVVSVPSSAGVHAAVEVAGEDRKHGRAAVGILVAVHGKVGVVEG